MEDESSGAVTSEDLHATYQDRSRKELQRRIDQLKRSIAEENAELTAISKKLQGAGKRGGTVDSKQQLDTVAEAYREVAASEPLLPFPDSVVPALVALRTTNATIDESKRYLASQKVSLQEAQERLGTEKASLADQRALTKALENRIQALRGGIEARTAMSPGQVARERLLELKQQIKETDADTSKLLKSLRNFIDEPLATMLAAEQIGGPVAGDKIGIDSSDLDAGFNARGKRKKSKAGDSPDKRQRRIDDMLGGRGQDRDVAGEEAEPDKRAAAKEEMQTLTEELLNKLSDAGGSGADAYIEVREESAAVRFLTRVKVAEFHPRDSKRLRLVDFGREIGN